MFVQWKQISSVCFGGEQSYLSHHGTERTGSSFTALLLGRDPLNTVLTGGIFSPSFSSTEVSSYTFHPSARSDHSCHGSGFCSTSQMLEQRHTDSSTDTDEAEDSHQGPGSTLLTLLVCPCSTTHHQMCCMEASQLTKRLPKIGGKKPGWVSS